MTRTARCPVLTLLAAGLLSCASSHVQVGSAFGGEASRYRTYAWEPGSEGPAPPKLSETIREAVRRELARKGIAEKPPQQADLWVSYYVVTGTGQAFGNPPGPWQWGPNVEAVSVRERSLTLEFIDPRTGKDLWQGTALDVIDRADESPDRISGAISELFKKFPSG